jgi:hypothetical protein
MASAASYGSLPFSEQIAFMRAKLPSVDYQRIQGDAHDKAFVSAGANRADLVSDLHQIVTHAIAEGLTLAEFRKDYEAVLDNYGWEPDGGRNWRARVIYETNLRSSYQAGRYSQLQEVKASRPYWVYNHSDAVQHPRELHLAWDGLAIHADDAWWKSHFPPNGWGCCCFVHAYSLEELQSRLGKSGPDTAPHTGSRTVTYKGSSEEVPNGIDPGWNYAPGRSTFNELVQGALQKTAALPVTPASAMNAQLLGNASATQAIADNWSAWLDEVEGDLVKRGRRMEVGSLSSSLIRSMQDNDLEPLTATISVGDGDILHTLRDTKANATTASGAPKALSMQELRELPEILANPQAVLLDSAASTLLYVFAAERREAGKIIVKVNYKLKGDERTNSVRSGSLIELQNLQKDVDNGSLVVLQGAL